MSLIFKFYYEKKYERLEALYTTWSHADAISFW